MWVAIASIKAGDKASYGGKPIAVSRARTQTQRACANRRTVAGGIATLTFAWRVQPWRREQFRKFAAVELGPIIATIPDMQIAIQRHQALRAFVYGVAGIAAIVGAFVMGRRTERFGDHHRAHAHWQRPKTVDHRILPPCLAQVATPMQQRPSIQQISEHEYWISRQLFDDALSAPMQYAKAARIVPALHNGPLGFKLYAIRPGSIFARLGIHNGDIIVAINDLDLFSAEKALTLYSTIRASSVFRVRIQRANERLTLTYRIQTHSQSHEKCRRYGACLTMRTPRISLAFSFTSAITSAA